MTHGILSLDFDGVLHPAADAVHVDFTRPAWQIALQLRTQRRFIWAEALARALEGSDVAILIHSTWRSRLSDAAMREILGEPLGSRIINADRWIAPQLRASLPHAAYIDQVLQAYVADGGACDSLCVIDDRPQMFEQDRHLLERWGAIYLWTDPNRGLSDDEVIQSLRRWCNGLSEAPDVGVAQPISRLA